MAVVNNDWKRARASGKEQVRFRIRMGDEPRSRFQANAEYDVTYSIAHGLVDAGLAEFINPDDNKEVTAPRDPTLKEVQDRAALYNIPTYDGFHKRDRTVEEMTADLDRADELIEFWMKMTKKQIQNKLRDLDQPTTGTKKSELVARLVPLLVRMERDDG